MAETKLIYSVKINGVEQQTKNIKSLKSEINNLGDSINEFSTNSIDQTSESFDNLTKSVDNASNELNNAGNNVDGFNQKVQKIDDSGLKKFDASAKNTTEKIDKLTFAGEKGFKGISDALKLFGIDTSILDNVKDGLGAIGDLLDSQSKVNEVAHNSAPAAKQAQTVKELAAAQQAATSATQAGAIATEASATATKGATVATNIFNSALKALPFLAVIAAISTVIALYTQWKNKQDEVKKSVEDSLKELSDGLDEYNTRLNNQLEILQNIKDQNIQNIDDQISGIEKQIQLLELQEGKENDIYLLRKKLIVLQQQQLQAQIDYSNNAINTAGTQIQNNNAIISQLQKEIDLRNESINLGLKGAKSDEDKNKIQDEIKQFQKEINELELSNNKLTSDKNEILLKIQENQNKLNTSKKYDLLILSETNKKEQERLKLQKEQAITELKRKIGQTFFDKVSAIHELNVLLKELQNKLNENKFKIDIETGNLSSSVDFLLSEIDKFESKSNKVADNTFKEITKQIDDLINSSKESVMSLFELTGKGLNIKISEKSKSDLENFIKDIGLPSDIFSNIDTTNLDAVLNEVNKKFKETFGGKKLNDEDLKLYNQALTNIKFEISEIYKNRNLALSQNSDLFDAAKLNADIEVLDKLKNEIGNITSIIDGRFTDSFNQVNNLLDDINNNFDKEKPFDFSLLFGSSNLKATLKDKINKPAEEAIYNLQQEIKKVNIAFNNLIEVNPEQAEKLKPLFTAIVQQLDSGIASIEKKTDETNKNIDSSVSKNLEKQVSKFFEYVKQIADFYSVIADLQIQNLSNQQDRINEELAIKEENFNKELEILQEFYDLQQQIIQDSTAKINDFENQLITARGSRAEFLLKLLATEQDKNQKALKAKEDAAKREKKLKAEQIAQEKAANAELDKIEEEKAKIRKRAAIATAIINTAEAVTMALIHPPGPPDTVPFAVAAGAFGAAQIAVIAATKYQKGGLFKSGGQLDGPSHADGGMPVFNQNNQKVAELEGGEFIVNKKQTVKNLNLLKQINSGKIDSSKSVIANVYSANSVRPNYDTIQSAIQQRNDSVNNLQVTVDNESIKQAIRDGMNNVVVQASILDIIEQNKKQIVINDLRRV